MECNGKGACSGVEECEKLLGSFLVGGGVNAGLGLEPDGSVVMAWSPGPGVLEKRNSDCTLAWQRAVDAYLGPFAIDDAGGIIIDVNREVGSAVKKFDDDGNPIFSLTYGENSPYGGWVLDAETDPMNDIVIVGSFSNSISFGGPTLTSSSVATDGFVAKLAVDGSHLFSVRFGDLELDDRVTAVGIDEMGEIVLAVNSTLVRLDLTGQTIWTRALDVPYDCAPSFPKPITQASCPWIREIEIDSAGDIIVGGDFDGRIDLGGGVLESAGGGDVFVAKLTADGNVLWQRRFGDETIQKLGGLALDSSDRIAISGHFSGTIDLGGGKYRARSRDEYAFDTPFGVFVALLGPDGDHLFSHQLTNGHGHETDIVAGDEGSLYVSGTFFRGDMTTSLFLMKLRTTGR